MYMLCSYDYLLLYIARADYYIRLLGCALIVNILFDKVHQLDDCSVTFCRRTILETH
jgi:hypothetical protein